MRVTCVASSVGAGGAERAAVVLAAWLASRGHTVTLATLREDVPDFHTVPQGVTRVRAGASAAADVRWWNVPGQLRRSGTLRALLLAQDPEVVVSFTDLTNVAVLQSLVRTKVPVVVSEQVDPRLPIVSRRWSALRRVLYPTAAAVLVQTEEVAAWARRAHPRWAVVVARNAVTPVGSRDDGARPAWFGPRNLVGMGRLVPQKGFDLLVPMFAEMAAEAPEWHLTLLGEGPDRPLLERLVADAGLQDRVHLPGLLNPPWRALAAADLFVFPSRFEGFPNALMEAMACGLPAVAFDCPTGPREIVRPGVDGALVPALDTRAFIAALRDVVHDDALRARMAAAAPDVISRFSPKAVMPVWEQALTSAVERGSKGRAAA